MTSLRLLTGAPRGFLLWMVMVRRPILTGLALAVLLVVFVLVEPVEHLGYVFFILRGRDPVESKRRIIFFGDLLFVILLMNLI